MTTTTAPGPAPNPALCLIGQLFAERGFDVPCACGHISDQCTKREDGTCDG